MAWRLPDSLPYDLHPRVERRLGPILIYVNSPAPVRSSILFRPVTQQEIDMVRLGLKSAIPVALVLGLACAVPSVTIAQTQRDDTAARGLKDDAAARGLKDDAAARGLKDDAAARGLKDDAAARGLKDDADGRGLKDDAAARAPK
jgi:hypothetical protein